MFQKIKNNKIRKKGVAEIYLYCSVFALNFFIYYVKLFI